MPGPLTGLRVVDLTQVLSGPFCTMLLADLGADVVKVEPPTGDVARLWGPQVPGDPVEGSYGGYFASINRNKRSVCLDLKSPTGRQSLLDLLVDADVLVENFRVGVMDRFELSYELLHARYPRLVYASIRGFGDPRTGRSPYADWPAFDIIAQAMGGVIGVTGSDADHPVKVGPGIGDIFPAALSAVGLLAAVRHADATGQGQLVDVAMYDSVLALTERIVYQHSVTGQSPVPQGNTHPLLCPYGMIRTADGFVTVAAPSDHHWRLLTEILGRPELGAAPAYATNAARLEHSTQVYAELEAWSHRLTTVEVVSALAGQIPCGPMNTAADIALDPHVAAREMIVQVEHPAGRSLGIAGSPIKLTGTPSGSFVRAPLLGEHTAEVLAALSRDAAPAPESSMPRDLARAMAQGLSDADVQRIFGMPGGGPNLDMLGCAEELGIPFALAHGETAACVMASTYGRLTGTPGVAVVTRGPGATSAANGLAQATLDRFPLLLVSDTVSSGNADRTAHQRVDQVAAATPLTKWSGTLGTADPVAVVTAAARLSLAGPAGAVHLAFDPTIRGDAPPPLPSPAVVDPAALARAAALIGGARRPVVIIGLDGARHGREVRAALARFDCPVLVTYEAKGVVPESSPNYAGLFTGATIERPLLEQADVILGIGLDPVEPMPGSWPYRAATVLLHSHPVETGYFGSPLVVVGPYPRSLDVLPVGRGDWEAQAGQEIRRAGLARLECGSDGLSPHDVVRTTHDVLPGALVTVDAGAHMLVVMPLWETDEPESVLISNGLATMGFALPAAIGTALARPGRRVVCFVGDGGLGMVLGELETLARLQLDVTVVVFNDAALTLIELKQAEGQGGRGAVRYGPIDFAQIACAVGVPGFVAVDVESLRVALAPGAPGPRLVDARVDPTSYRHVIHATRGG